MTQQLSLGLADVAPTPRRHRGVQRTSVLAYHAHGRMSERERLVLDLLLKWQGPAPTSLEFAHKHGLDVVPVRCGLSDARDKGLVETCGKRICQQSGHLVLLWRVRTR